MNPEPEKQLRNNDRESARDPWNEVRLGNWSEVEGAAAEGDARGQLACAEAGTLEERT